MFGPNGSGKSTLLNAIIGLPGYKISNGEILFENKNIIDLSIDEKVKLGMAIGYQHPIEMCNASIYMYHFYQSCIIYFCRC